MIRDRMENAHTYLGLNPSLDKVLSILVEGQVDVVGKGRHEIDGDRLFSLVQEYETKPLSEGKFEAHRKYVDVQVVLEGRERMGYASIKDVEESVPYDTERDCAFYSVQSPAPQQPDLFLVKAGEFAVFFPQDAHMPCIEPAPDSGSGSDRERPKVKKVVFKIRI